MSILKPDFSPVVKAIEGIMKEENVDWNLVISRNRDEMREVYDEIMDKVEEVKDRVWC